MTDGLKDAHREAIIAALAANDRVERAVLFGSRATETNTVTSDVDIALIGDRLTLTDRARLSAVIDEIPMAQSVDLLLYDSVRDRTLREHIRREGIEWYARPSRDGERGTVSKRLGPANGGWSRVPLGSFVTLQRGHDLPSAVRRPGNTPILGSFGVTGWHDESRAAGPGVTVGRSGASFGVVTYSPVDYWPLNTALYVTDFHGNDQRFVYYFLKHFDFRSYNSGSAQPSLNRNYIHPIPVDIPPVAEQRAIAHVLGTLDDKIEVNRRMNETLEGMARALFKSWFVDFDPVRAKIEGLCTGLRDEIDSLFPDRFVDSDLGSIPSGWRAGTLKEIVSLNPESWTSQRHPETVAYVDLANTKWGYIGKVKSYPWKKTPSRARRVLRRGDTIVATVRPANGSFALVDQEGLTGSTGFAVLRPKELHDRESVWCAATSKTNIDRLAHLADGAAYPAIRPPAVVAAPVALPDHRVRKAFSAATAPLLDRLEANKRESRSLATLRDVLLPRLVSGKISVHKEVA